MSAENVIRIPPYKYVHILDTNTNITRLETGPAIYIRKEHEAIVNGPNDMIKLAPRQYCTISNPVVTKKNGQPQLTEFGQVKVLYGEKEIRTSEKYPEPFPLYPDEELEGKVETYRILTQNQALRLTALRDFKDEDLKVERSAGDEWQLIGPLTYIPRVEEAVTSTINAQVIKPNSALKLKANRDCKDKYGEARKTGEEWLIREVGSYLPQISEDVISHVAGYVITEKQCLRLTTKIDFKDVYGIERKAGDSWLVTPNLTQLHIPDVYEEAVEEVIAITLSNREYCIILDPYDKKTRTNNFGKKELRKGELTFFLQPGELVEEDTIQPIRVLTEDDALLLQAVEDFKDSDGTKRKAGESWLIQGPREYIPPVEVQIVEQRKKIPLDENEGIYVRNIQTGEVRMETGKTYLLEAHEQLWEKELPDLVEYLVAMQKVGLSNVMPKYDRTGNLIWDLKGYKRDKTRVITYKVPHNYAVQLYDFKLKTGRVIFGPSLLMLGPYEQFSVLSLSGGRPKKEGTIKSLSLHLGPSVMLDVVDIETSDHARLQFTLAYNWQFKYDKNDPRDCEKLFKVPDFIGDACKSIASRIRGAVSSVTFEDFHKRRKDLIQNAVFGVNSDGTPKEELLFPANNLQIKYVDVQNPEPLDPRMRESLFKAQTLNIEITTRTQELNANHQAMKLEQESKGRLEIQKFNDQAQAESAKKDLLLLKAENEGIKMKGNAVALSKAQAEAELIQIEAEVNQAKLRAEALLIESKAELEARKQDQEAELAYQKAKTDLEIKKKREFAEIETKKFKQLVQAIGKETIVSMAKAGPETQAKMLSGLGLKGFLISDGKNPINLFNTANGMLGSMGKNGK
jgi:major vault protein